MILQGHFGKITIGDKRISHETRRYIKRALLLLGLLDKDGKVSAKLLDAPEGQVRQLPNIDRLNRSPLRIMRMENSKKSVAELRAEIDKVLADPPQNNTAKTLSAKLLSLSNKDIIYKSDALGFVIDLNAIWASLSDAEKEELNRQVYSFDYWFNTKREFAVNLLGLDIEGGIYEVCIVIDRFGNVKGYVISRILSNGQAYIDRMCTDQRDNVRGRGTMLMEAIMERIKRAGIKSMRLTPRRAEESRAFYINFFNRRKIKIIEEDLDFIVNIDSWKDFSRSLLLSSVAPAVKIRADNNEKNLSTLRSALTSTRVREIVRNEYLRLLDNFSKLEAQDKAIAAEKMLAATKINLSLSEGLINHSINIKNAIIGMFKKRDLKSVKLFKLAVKNIFERGVVTKEPRQANLNLYNIKNNVKDAVLEIKIRALHEGMHLGCLLGYISNDCLHDWFIPNIITYILESGCDDKIMTGLFLNKKFSRKADARDWRLTGKEKSILLKNGVLMDSEEIERSNGSIPGRIKDELTVPSIHEHDFSMEYSNITAALSLMSRKYQEFGMLGVLMALGSATLEKEGFKYSSLAFGVSLEEIKKTVENAEKISRQMPAPDALEYMRLVKGGYLTKAQELKHSVSLKERLKKELEYLGYSEKDSVDISRELALMAGKFSLPQHRIALGNATIEAKPALEKEIALELVRDITSDVPFCVMDIPSLREVFASMPGSRRANCMQYTVLLMLLAPIAGLNIDAIMPHRKHILAVIHLSDENSHLMLDLTATANKVWDIKEGMKEYYNGTYTEIDTAFTDGTRAYSLRQPQQGLVKGFRLLSKKAFAVTAKGQMRLLKQPLELVSGKEAALLYELRRMQRMFAAYSEILSSYGMKIRGAVNTAIANFEKGQAGASELKEAEEIIAMMPDRDYIDIEKGGKRNWINWFKLDPRNFSIPYADNMPIGEGCIWPCQHCIKANRAFLARNDPLPVAIDKIMKNIQDKKAKEYMGLDFIWWSANDLIYWCDPFFGAYINGLLEFAVRSLREQGNTHQARIFVTTRGYAADELRIARAVEKIKQMSISDPNFSIPLWFNLSFHLCSIRNDVIRAIYKEAGKRVPSSVIEEYARYYANLIRTLKEIKTLNKFTVTAYLILTLDKEEYAVFNNATLTALEEALRIAGIEEKAISNVLEEGHRATLFHCAGRYVDAGDMRVEFLYISSEGRGAEFLSRLKSAISADKSCLPDQNKIFSGGRDRYVGSFNGYPRLEINNAGEVVVRSINNPDNILISSSLDELDPVDFFDERPVKNDTHLQERVFNPEIFNNMWDKFQKAGSPFLTSYSAPSYNIEEKRVLLKALAQPVEDVAEKAWSLMVLIAADP
ncbi:MAG: hypothetical protein PHE15_05920, partial [Dehalococcoidales bacterium]|nr:hypothetical protein [Dehalococcoidales bacterium]